MFLIISFWRHSWPFYQHKNYWFISMGFFMRQLFLLWCMYSSYLLLFLTLYCELVQLVLFLLYLSNVKEEGGGNHVSFRGNVLYFSPISTFKSLWWPCTPSSLLYITKCFDVQNGQNMNFNYNICQCVGLKLNPEGAMDFYSIHCSRMAQLIL